MEVLHFLCEIIPMTCPELVLEIRQAEPIVNPLVKSAPVTMVSMFATVYICFNLPLCQGITFFEDTTFLY